jgi:YidC/Oxa1 family membrane protein insertase
MQTRTIVAVVLSFLVFFLFTYLGQHYGPKPPEQAPATQATEPAPAPGQPAPVSSPTATAPTPVPKPVPSRPAREVVVDTDLYRAVFTEEGAGLKSFQLKKFRQSLPIDVISKFAIGPVSFELERFRDGKNAATEPKELITAAPNQEIPLSLTFEGGTLAAAPNLLYEANKPAVTLKGAEANTLTFKGVTPAGLAITKTYQFQGDSYVFRLQAAVAKAAQNLEGRLTLPLTGTSPATPQEAQELAVLADGKFDTFAVGKLKEPKVFTGKVKWAGLNELYFLSAAVPQGAPQTQAILVETPPNQLSGTLSLPANVPAGQEVQAFYAFYFGPKSIHDLAAANLDLDKAVHFGWFDVLARPALQFLKWLNSYVNNWGWSLIILTILLRVVFWYPNHKSFQSMKVMQKIQPRVAEIREKYKEDREGMNRELMNLYRTFKVNPMGGCLPMVLQLPVFLALYNMLGSSIELRHAAFIPTLPFTNIVWLADLSAKDPLLITPIIMGVSMFFQQKMSPSPGDPAQAKMMMFLPLIFTFLFLNFASGLVIYWLVNNVLAIAQQYFTNKYIQ